MSPTMARGMGLEASGILIRGVGQTVGVTGIVRPVSMIRSNKKTYSPSAAFALLLSFAD